MVTPFDVGKQAAYLRRLLHLGARAYGYDAPLSAARGRLRLRLSVAVTVELRTWILGHGAHVEVLSPQSLVDQIRDELELAAKRYAT